MEFWEQIDAVADDYPHDQMDFDLEFHYQVRDEQAFVQSQSVFPTDQLTCTCINPCPTLSCTCQRSCMTECLPPSPCAVRTPLK